MGGEGEDHRAGVVDEDCARRGSCASSSSLRKRDLMVSLALMQGLRPTPAALADDEENTNTNTNATDGLPPEGTTFFQDDKNLFRLALPTGWEVVNKAGATLLLRDPAEKYSQIGVTVSPVKIASLSEFGSVHEIGEKLLKAEAAKESTVPGGVTLLSETTRQGPRSAAVFYDYDYRLVTTHGNKRVLNSVAVENNTLYIMNAQVYEQNEDKWAPKYHQVAKTFDVGQKGVGGGSSAI